MVSGPCDHEERVQDRNKWGLKKKRVEEKHEKVEGKRLVGYKRRNKHYL